MGLPRRGNKQKPKKKRKKKSKARTLENTEFMG